MRAISLGLAMTVGLGNLLPAQLANGKWSVSPHRGRAAVGTSPPAVVVAPAQQFPVQPVAFNFVPAVLMSDGTIWANFGFGFEPIVRPCSQPLTVGQPAVVGANGMVLQPARPTYTQPVPNQQTPSQQMVSARVGGTSSIPVVSPAQFSCFSRNAAGQLVAFR